MFRNSAEENTHDFSHPSTLVAIALIDQHHRIAAVTGAMAELLGYSVAEMCGMTFEQITYPPDVDIDADLAGRMFEGEIDSYEMVKRYVRKDGSLLRVLLTAVVVRDPQGRIVHGIGQIRPLGNTPAKAMPIFQHSGEPNDEIDRIKRAMFD